MCKRSLWSKETKIDNAPNLQPYIPSLRSIYLAGNLFQCHCSLRWIQHVIENQDRVGGFVVKDGAEVRMIALIIIIIIIIITTRSVVTRTGQSWRWRCKTPSADLTSCRSSPPPTRS